jgi:NAD dependent epimerase/dehydratase family enzyme
MNLKRLTYFGVILIILLMNVATGATGNITGNDTVDPTALTDAIAKATAKVDSAVAGTGVGQYPQSAIDALNDAIDDAEKVADDTSSTQPQIDAALAALNEAIDVFDASKITTVPVDKTALTAAIKAANTKVKAAVAGTDIGQYPQSAIDTFNTAISAAQKFLTTRVQNSLR